MFGISIESTIKEGIDFLEKAKNSIPYALSQSLNETAKNIKAGEVDEMRNAFDRPTPFTLNSLWIRFAQKDDLTAEVGFRDFAGKGTPAGHYLQPQVDGGGRPMKKSEKMLGAFWVPAPGVKLDRYGNISPGQITQILSVLGAFPQVGYSMNRSRRSRQQNKKPRDYFIVRRGDQNHLRPGVWERLGGHRLRPILFFIDAPSYQIRYRFYEVAEKVLKEGIQDNFNIAIVRELLR